jgi:hypothetical protein
MQRSAGCPPGPILRPRTFPPRGKSAVNPWRSRFSRNRAPPHRRHRFAATKICAIRFATSLPQDSSAQVMFELGEIPTGGLSRSLRLEFCVDRLDTSRGAASRMPHKRLSRHGFRAHLRRMPCHAAQALQASRFFALSAGCAGANCLRFAATRLKFAARLGRFALSSPPHFGPFTSSPSIDVRLRGLDDESRNGIRPQSTTIFTLSRTLTCACGSSPFSTRNRSAGRSMPAMRCDSDSTVSPGCTVITFMRNGRAA